MLEVPKGTFFQGPEQADAAIDQDAFISQQIGLWTRLGLDVIRGHTTPLIVDGELIYIEPMFTRSVQNPVPQLKRVVVVVRGKAFMGQDLGRVARGVRPAAESTRSGPARSSAASQGSSRRACSSSSSSSSAARRRCGGTLRPCTRPRQSVRSLSR